MAGTRWDRRVQRVFDARVRLIRPVKVEEIDALDTKSPQRRLALLSDRGGPPRPSWLSRASAFVEDQPTLREHVGPIIRREIAKLGVHFLGIPEALECGSVDPVDP